ncbi:APC family permease [Streptosporangium roseum]|uniref:Amino acid transporter n=1 Tax=Streptosporangium roseum (strain ATCC 12428 / DSM 43021 / JCM 3005 / KCTC 9067 / NCIMB 10171 / NRRL 2505 / NI 9100) TaxID=479432 RepID=D2B1E7_STRRD|nr:APC family permease [Streptosporangium roseum]ACZ85412.1 amino acid transporter [Streptosporangium roseum DSM 43021]
MTSPTPEVGQVPLKRAIGPKLLLLFIVGDILGTGVYALTGKVAGKVGGALWIPFLVGFVIAALTAMSYVELVTKYPRAAGAALYTQRAFRTPFLTFMVAFTVMCSGLTSASAAARAIGGDYLKTFVTVPGVIVGIVFIVAIALLNYRGVSESVKTNIVFTIIELTGLLVIIVIGVYAVATGAGEPARLTEIRADQEGGLFLALLGSTALAFFAFVGFEDSVNMAEETRDPSRNFPRAIFLGVAITSMIYILVAVTSSLLVDHRVLEKSSGPLLEVVKAGGISFPPQLFAVIAMFAVANSALINMMMASRLVYGLANERVVPRALGRVDPRRRTPVVGIIFTTALAIALISTGDIAGLGDTTAFLLLCVFTIVNVAVLVLRKDTVDHAHYRAPTILPVLGAVLAFVLASPLTGRPAEVYIRAGVLLGIGLLLWVVNWLVTRRQAPAE